MVSGSGFPLQVGRGFRASPGAGPPITTDDGITCRDLVGHGYPASDLLIEDTVAGTITGDLLLSTSSTVRLREVTTSAGIRCRPESAGTGPITGEELTTRTCNIHLHETDREDPTMEGSVLDRLSNEE